MMSKGNPCTPVSILYVSPLSGVEVLLFSLLFQTLVLTVDDVISWSKYISSTSFLGNVFLGTPNLPLPLILDNIILLQEKKLFTINDNNNKSQTYNIATTRPKHPEELTVIICKELFSMVSSNNFFHSFPSFLSS